ncbi:hypothetical protein EC973_005949 [Apophysomyces ossiformis]|uniref:Protein kinase domain-containing protein n=1 Tax=Apophysomyces ossiformis TaxID=679940 RepID=A0A8H7BRM5_9FUNG|nr:hypothetical protein EC973_005949 [Apophysomyces ossiformis]
MTTSKRPLIPIGSLIGDYQILEVLGIGGYGQVYLAQHIRTKVKYAIKSLPQAGLDERQKAFQRTEIALHSQLSHPNVIRFDRVIRQGAWIHVVLEYGPEGDLFSAIAEKDLYYGNHQRIRRTFLQLLDAVSYCHDNHIYHRDLKPENILMFDDGRVVKLADFGLATTNTISKEYGCGSSYYFSPECQGDLAQEHHMGYVSATNDIWSLGIILINLAAGRNPWRQASLKDETFRAYIEDPDLLYRLLPISRELNHILKRMLAVDPLDRMSLDEIRQRIKRCRYFTRTPECERYENEKLLKPRPIVVVNVGRCTPDDDQTTLLPSPPDTPRSSSTCSDHPWVTPPTSASSSSSSKIYDHSSSRKNHKTNQRQPPSPTTKTQQQKKKQQQRQQQQQSPSYSTSPSSSSSSSSSSCINKKTDPLLSKTSVEAAV